MPRQVRAERTREALLDAAAAEFAAHGFERARIMDMLDRAGTTKGALYHHFTTKQDMADAILAEDSHRWPELMDRVAATGARGLVGLAELAGAIASTVQEDARALAVLRIVEEQEGSDRFVFVLWQSAITRNLQQAIADGDLSDEVALVSLATVIADCIYGVCLSPAPWGGPGVATQRVGELLSVLLTGVRGA